MPNVFYALNQILCFGETSTRFVGIVTGMGPSIWKGLFLKKKDIWREQNTDIRRCDHLNNQGKGDIVSEKVILFFIGYDLGMVYGGEADLEFVKKITRPNLSAKEFYTLKTRK